MKAKKAEIHVDRIDRREATLTGDALTLHLYGRAIRRMHEIDPRRYGPASVREQYFLQTWPALQASPAVAGLLSRMPTVPHRARGFAEGANAGWIAQGHVEACPGCAMCLPR